VYAFTAYLPPTLRDWISQKVTELRVILVENGILPSGTPEDGSESKSVTDARTKLQNAERDRDNHQNDLNTNEQDFSKSYGPDDIFLALKGECVDVDSGEYTYEHCFLDRTMQKPNKGGMDTNMGYFDRIEWITVDEEEPADGKGLGSGERIAIKYENGAQCWNGPARSTTVILACAEKNEIWRVIEEEKCSYRMEAGSPAACPVEGDAAGSGSLKFKDEL
jgi:protein kinase C substrate 80K-H